MIISAWLVPGLGSVLSEIKIWDAIWEFLLNPLNMPPGK